MSKISIRRIAQIDMTLLLLISNIIHIQHLFLFSFPPCHCYIDNQASKQVLHSLSLLLVCYEQLSLLVRHH